MSRDNIWTEREKDYNSIQYPAGKVLYENKSIDSVRYIDCFAPFIMFMCHGNRKAKIYNTRKTRQI